ncbi:DUF420 domain-containing protein [Paenibacillus sp. GCM10023252]|uniref:DUF420 domain-containing protein n=1 Tax=Paenibacillus sp. GCM10023252 TaxID=3252649 RepID=UPI003619F607
MDKSTRAIPERAITWIIIGLTALINGIVLALLFLPQLGDAEHDTLILLPLFNAVMNGFTFLFLLLALYMIAAKKNITWHRRFIFAAFTTTTFFLVSYLTYHSMAESTSFGGEGLVAGIYYFILITHIVLAAAIVPLALFTVVRGLQMKVDKHRKLARWTMPIWLYVSLSGVIVYLMISPYYA